MAIKLTYKDLDNQMFNRAMVKISSYGFTNSLVAYNAAKLWRKLKIELQTAQEIYLKLLKKYSKLDESGGFIPRSDDEGKPIPNTYQVVEGKEEEFKAALAEYEKVTFEIACHQLRVDQLEEVKLTPMEMGALDMVLVEAPQSAEVSIGAA